MTEFLGENFLLSTPAAQRLYRDFAADMPIIDYHCHVSPKEIWEDKRFENIAQVWLSGDHYKWRLMRANGVDEKYITGNTPDREKFQKFAELLPKAIGNPMYHWCHLELKNYFGYNGVLNAESAEEVWRLCENKLKESNMSVRGLISQSNVKFIGTTDDPTDSLEYHEKLNADNSFKTVVAPSFRPDKALNLDKLDWKEYISSLAKVSKVEIVGIDTLKEALRRRIAYFDLHGCRASDHGLDKMLFARADSDTLDRTVKNALGGKSVTESEIAAVKTELLIFCAEEYEKLGWVMQIHFNCIRNPNSAMFDKIGADTGFDCIGPNNGSAALAKFLDTLYAANALPKTVLYSLDGNDNAFLDSLAGSFQGGAAGKIQHGSAWWFNDTKDGMLAQLKSFAAGGLLGNFIGMLTDSRSFLSYARHEYFRRILCGLLGEWVESGEYPCDFEILGELVKDISYNNAVRYFGLENCLK